MKILYVATISLTINSFFKSHIEMLVKEGNQVDIACNYKNLPLDNFYKELGCNFYQIDFSRSPLSFDNLKACRQLKQLLKSEKYDIVHCHTPNASVITRLICKKFRKKNGLKVFYTAHGFHFYKGAPKLNWMVYYPIEKICSKYTDVLITINREDYALASKKMKAKRVEYVPGVGIDLSKFKDVQVDRLRKRSEIGVPDDAVLLFSVGELNENKNHQVIIKALAKINNENIHYAIAGVGVKRDYLIDLAKRLGVENQVHFLGYRKDIPELNSVADVFCFPSIREGLPVSLIEAATADLPLIAAKNRGTVDIIDDNKNGILCSFDDVNMFAEAIKKIINNIDDLDAWKEHSKTLIDKYDTVNIVTFLKKVYDSN